jgi:hypothetical protein
MAREMKPVDITHTPDVLRLAEEVARSGVPHVLRRDNEDLVEVRPVSPARQRARRRSPSKRGVDNSWLENIIGIASKEEFPDIPTDISSNVDTYLYGNQSTDK